MECPVCRNGVQLVVSERQSIEIDYCPTCRGVWLDRGELDKIIERSAPASRSRDDDFDRGDDDAYRSGRPYKKRRGSFLSELFDFG